MSARHRICVVTDLEAYSGAGPDGHRRLQRVLFEALDDALAAALGPAADECFRQPKGDAELTMLPAEIDQRTVLRVLLRELAGTLVRENGTFRPEHAVRLRIGIDAGITTMDRGGVVGDSPIVASRLCDADVTKQALSDSDGHYVVMVSDHVYQDVIAPAFLGDPSWTFRSVAVTVKTYRATGWLHVPGEPRSSPGRPVVPEGGLI